MRLPVRPASRAARLLLALVLLLPLAVFDPPPAPAQGCSQCSQAIGQTPARTQAAYRRAILLLIVAGGGVFTAAVLTLRRFR